MDKIKLEARRKAREEAERLARIEAEKNQPHVKDIVITIEWVRSQMWGYNPRMRAECFLKDGRRLILEDRASGCGYDKESTVIASAFNAFLKYKLHEKGADKLERQQKEASWEQRWDAIPYGIYIFDGSAHYEGGIGTECYYKIAEYIGGEFTKVASGANFDAFKYIDKTGGKQ